MICLNDPQNFSFPAESAALTGWGVKCHDHPSVSERLRSMMLRRDRCGNNVMRHEFEFPAAPLAELALTAPLKAMTRPSTGITTTACPPLRSKGNSRRGRRASTYPSAFLLRSWLPNCEFLYIVTTSASSSCVGLRKEAF